MWRGRTYQNFDLVLSRGPGGRFAASVRGAPGGDGVATFSMPFTEVELDEFFEEIGHPRDPRRRRSVNVTESARRVGTRLFETVFDQAVGRSFQQSLSAVRGMHDDAGREHGLRVRLNLTDVPELAGLPWEFLWSPSLPGFLLSSDRTPVVRWLDREGVARPLPVRLPLRILCVFSEPTGVVELDVEREWQSIREALAPVVQTGQISLEVLEPPITLDRLRWRLAETSFHVLHFVGHGAYDSELETGVVLFETEKRREAAVPADHLAAVLADHDPLKLVVLNACEGARSGHDDVFNGTAQRLVAGHVPAVVGMQFEITDRAAVDLARNLYTALAQGRPVDAALTEARKAMYTRPGNVEWATPVLFMNAPDGHLFDISQDVRSDHGPQPSPSTDPARERGPVPSGGIDHEGDRPRPPGSPAVTESRPAGTSELTEGPARTGQTAPSDGEDASLIHGIVSDPVAEDGDVLTGPRASDAHDEVHGAPAESSPGRGAGRRGPEERLRSVPTGIRVLATWGGLHALGTGLGVVVGGLAGAYDSDSVWEALLAGTTFGLVLGAVWVLAYRLGRRPRRVAGGIGVTGDPALPSIAVEDAGRTAGGISSMTAHPTNALASATLLFLGVATDQAWLAMAWLAANFGLLVAFALLVRRLRRHTI